MTWHLYNASVFTVALSCSLFMLLISGSAVAEERPPVRHPNLMLNREEIEQIKEKTQKHEWAAKLFEQLKDIADNGPGYRPRESALAYVLTGDARYGEDARHRLTSEASYSIGRYEAVDLEVEPEFGAWSALGEWAWAYDLAYDVLSDDERALVERWLRIAAETIIEDFSRWEDWSIAAKLMEIHAGGQQPWNNAMIIKYLEACPLPEAKQFLRSLSATQ